MVDQLIEALWKHKGKSISLGTMAIILTIGLGIIMYGDTRWCLADDAQQTQQTMEVHIEQGLEDSIMVITMKQNGATQEAIDAALLKKYEGRLKDMRDKRNKPQD